jgi:hypothetical protein
VYIDTTMNAAAKIPAVKITITRAEGPSVLCGRPTEFVGHDCWLQANDWLEAMSPTFPASGGYDKHDFTVEWADGEVFTGRLDCKSATCEGADLDVAAHVFEFFAFLILGPIDQRARARGFLGAHAVGMGPLSPGEAARFLAALDEG